MEHNNLGSSIDTLRQQCWDIAVESYGTGYIFEQRANRIRILQRILTFLGIAVPAAIGSIALSFGNASIVPFLGIAGALGLAQFIGSVWSVVAKWDDTYSYALESLEANYRLANSYHMLAQSPSSDTPEFVIRMNLLNTEDQLRSASDNKQGITEKERRMGMRAALRQYQRACSQCKKVPTSMTPSDCDICGKF